MSMSSIPFAPKAGATQTLAVGPTPNVAAVNPGPGRCRRLRLFNAGPAMVFVELTGAEGAVSPETGMPLAAGASDVFTIPGSSIATVTASGSAILYATPGEGG